MYYERTVKYTCPLCGSERQIIVKGEPHSVLAICGQCGKKLEITLLSVKEHKEK